MIRKRSMRRHHEIVLRPIGRVETTLRDDEIHEHHKLPPSKRTNVSKIIIREDLARELEGIDSYSHLNIIWYLHRLNSWSPLHNSTMRRSKARAKGGVLSTRSPRRPNPIGLSRVRLIERKGRILYVKGLDAFDGTPILDIKPYTRWDRVSYPKVPPSDKPS